MASKYIDFHNHLQNAYNQDVVALPSFRLGVDVIPPYIPEIWVGIHPYDCELDIDFLELIKSVKNKIIGIGEIGVDYYYDSSNMKRQDSVFIKQLNFAIEQDMPVTIHCVRGYNKLAEWLKEKESLPPIILHGFINSVQMAEEFIKIGCYISFSPASFASRKTVEVMKSIPLNRLFLESDDTNVDIKALYRLFSQYRSETLEEIVEVLYNNFKKIVGKCQIG